MNFLKALVPSEPVSIKRAGWRDLTFISPKEQGDLSGIVLPLVTANNNKTEGLNENDLLYLKGIYECHDLVYSSIDLVSSTFGLGKLRVKKRDSNGKYKLVPDHPLQALLDNPNSSMTGYDLRQSYIVHRLLYGTVGFILLRDSMTDADNTRTEPCPQCALDNSLSKNCIHVLWSKVAGPVTQIMPVHLDRLSQKEYTVTKNGVSKQTTLFVYNYGSVSMPIHPSNIMTDPLYNPTISFWGTSPTMLIKRWLEIDLGLSKQVGAYFANNAIPSMVVNLKPASADKPYDKDPSQILESMKEFWMKKYSMRGDGIKAGPDVKAPAFLYGDIDIKKIQDTIKEIVVKDLFYEIQNRVAMLYKIPRSFFEFGLDHSSQGSAAKEQKEDFFNYAISPQLESFQAKVQRHILPTFSDHKDLKLEWDLSSMGVASFIDQKKRDGLRKDWELGGISLDEFREGLGRDPFHDKEQGDDRYRITVLSDGQTSINPTGPKLDNNLLVRPRIRRDRDPNVTQNEE